MLSYRITLFLLTCSHQCRLNRRWKEQDVCKVSSSTETDTSTELTYQRNSMRMCSSVVGDDDRVENDGSRILQAIELNQLTFD